MNYFEELSTINVNDKTEKKNGLTYLSWVYAISEVKKKFPDFTYTVERFGNNLPYVYDEHTGYMVFTNVTVEGVTTPMWLPVMDGANKAMKSYPYKYKVKKKDGSTYEKDCEAATMFDVNKAIMRCLCKNIAVATGLGLYIYSNEDMPEDIAVPCAQCGKGIEAGGGMTSAQVAEARTKKFGQPLCQKCANALRDKKEGAPNE